MNTKAPHTDMTNRRTKAAQCLQGNATAIGFKILCIPGNAAICVQQFVGQLGAARLNSCQYPAILRETSKNGQPCLLL